MLLYGLLDLQSRRDDTNESPALRHFLFQNNNDNMASSEATKNAKADVYGQFHPAETKELILEKLEDFQAEINKLPDDVKKCLMEAEEKCPDLVTDDFKLIFLRSEVFNADVSVHVMKTEAGEPGVFLTSRFCLSARCETICQLLGQKSRSIRTGESIFALDFGRSAQR